MNKMTLIDLKGLFPPYMGMKGGNASSATRKGYKHNHKPTWKPAKPDQTPAQWKRANHKKA